MQIRRFLKFLFVGIFCIFCVSGFVLADTSATTATPEASEQIDESEPVLNEHQARQYTQSMHNDAFNFQQRFERNVNSPRFVPIEVKLGLMFMKALSSIDYILQISSRYYHAYASNNNLLHLLLYISQQSHL